MNDDPFGADDRQGREPGRRKDGKPFKDGNTRADGSYDIGKYRTPPEHRFQKGDGRKRGKRQKGSKNVAAIWSKKLKQKIAIDGKVQTAAEWLVEGMIRRGISKSDRAAESALMQAGMLDAARESLLGKTDIEIIEAWLAQRMMDGGVTTTDDYNAPGPASVRPSPGDPEDGNDAGE